MLFYYEKEFAITEDEGVEEIVGAKIKTKAEGAPKAPKARPRKGATTKKAE